MMTPETTINKSTLFANMAKVMGDITRIPKSGKVDYTHNGRRTKYEYANESDIADLIRPLMAKHNLAFFCSMNSVTPAGNKTRVTFEMTIACGESGASITSTWYGEQGGADDKSINAATTSAIRYFLMKTFCVSSGDPRDDIEPDVNLNESDQKKRQGRASKPKPTNSNGTLKSLGDLYNAVHKALPTGMTVNEIAELAMVEDWSMGSFNNVYKDLDEAFEAIKDEYAALNNTPPATPKAEATQPEEVIPPTNGNSPEQPTLLDAPKKEVSQYDADPFPKN